MRAEENTAMLNLPIHVSDATRMLGREGGRVSTLTIRGLLEGVRILQRENARLTVENQRLQALLAPPSYLPPDLGFPHPNRPKVADV